MMSVCETVSERWKQVCTYLGIPSEKISQSEQNNMGNVTQACFEAMCWWREGNCKEENSPPTWKVLLDAMRKAGFPDRADTVQEELTLGVL